MSLDARGIDYKALVQDDRIHVSLYTDPRIFDDEMDRIFTLTTQPSRSPISRS